MSVFLISLLRGFRCQSLSVAFRPEDPGPGDAPVQAVQPAPEEVLKTDEALLAFPIGSLYQEKVSYLFLKPVHLGRQLVSHSSGRIKTAGWKQTQLCYSLFCNENVELFFPPT